MSDSPLTAAFLEYLDAQEAAILAARRLVSFAQSTPTVNEEAFRCLSFEKQVGKQIGEYEVAYKASNLPDKFQHAYSILRQNNATIAHQYHEDGYTHSYCLYGEDKIYRRPKKQPQGK